MSVVATKVTDKEIVMVADSQTTKGWTVEKHDATKIFQTENGITVGGCGLSEQTILLRLFCETHIPRAATEDDLLSFFAEFVDWIRRRTSNNSYDVNNYFHIAFSDRAFEVHNYFIKEITDYNAIGAGMEYALAALYLGQTPERAVEAACDLNIYCEKPINVFRIPITRGGQ